MSHSDIRAQSSFQKYALLFGAFGLAAAIGSIWLGWTLTLLLLAVGAVITTFSLQMAPKQILRWQRAQKLDRYYQWELYQLINRLAQRAGLSHSPDVYLVNSRVPTAFALGSKERPIIGITSGLINVLNERELSGVLAHEISHIKNNDLLVKGLATSFGNLTNTLSWVGRLLLLLSVPMMLMGIETVSFWAILVLIISPVFNVLLQMGLSRSMEYLADHDAALITQDPMGLATALYRIETLSRPWWARFWQPAMAQTSAEWLRSHPETSKRIAKLKALVGSSGSIPIRRPMPKSDYFWDQGSFMFR